MYICVCKAITEEKAKVALKSGRSINEIMKKLGIGTDCGTCIGHAIECLKCPGPSGSANSHTPSKNNCSNKK